MNEINALTTQAAELRKTLTKMIYKAKAGHIGGSLSSADIITVLYFSIMNIDPMHPKAVERDRFILSKVHSVEAYYSALATKSFFPMEELATFSCYQSRLLGHPSI